MLLFITLITTTTTTTTVYFLSLGHSEDVGIECSGHKRSIASGLFRSGIEFSDGQAASSSHIEYADIVKAPIGIKSKEAAPSLRNIWVRECVIGAKIEKLDSLLTISDSLFTGNVIKGIDITSGHASIEIRDTIVSNTTMGDGMTISRDPNDLKDFCSLIVSTVRFPLNLKATGTSGTNTDCFKVTQCNSIFLN